MLCTYKTKIINGRNQLVRQSLEEDELLEAIEKNCSKIIRSKPTPCWEWNGQRSPKGYGVTGFKYVVFRVHRLVWILTNGPIPKDKEICHSCDNPPCCNIGHLFIGTHRDNMRDAKTKNRLKAHLGSAHGCAKLNEAQVLEIRAKYKPFKVSRHALAKEYGVSYSLVVQITRRHIWKHI